MIKNERQYRITKSRVDELRRSIAELTNADLSEGLDPAMRELQLDALRSVLADLEGELADYDALHDTTEFEATGLNQLPVTLIRARIARGLTQRQLAERVGLKAYPSERLLRVAFSPSRTCNTRPVRRVLRATGLTC